VRSGSAGGRCAYLLSEEGKGWGMPWDLGQEPVASRILAAEQGARCASDFEGAKALYAGSRGSRTSPVKLVRGADEAADWGKSECGERGREGKEPNALHRAGCGSGSEPASAETTVCRFEARAEVSSASCVDCWLLKGAALLGRRVGRTRVWSSARVVCHCLGVEFIVHRGRARREKTEPVWWHLLVLCGLVGG
jgi:hypothetical protein